MARRSKRGCSITLGLGVALLLALGQLFGPAQRAQPDERREPPAQDREGEHAGQLTESPQPQPAPTPKTPRPRAEQRIFDDASPWASPEACEAALRALPPRHDAARARLGTWNLGWFPDGSAGEPKPDSARDVAWLACIIATLDVDVLAVQEVVQHARGRAALLDLVKQLDARTGGRFEAVLDECPDDGRQHLGFLYDGRRVRLAEAHVLRELNPGRNACDHRLRPGLAARFTWATGVDLEAVTVHLDSGVIERDYTHRAKSVAQLAELLPRLARSPASSHDDVVVLGDWNTMGCERCLPAVSAAEETAALDAVLPALVRVEAAPPCSHYYRGRAGLLDHVLVTRDTRELPKGARVEAHGACAARTCEPLSRSASLRAFAHLSDHCPLVLELDAQDLD